MAHARPKSSIPLPKSPASPKGVYQASFSSAPSPAKQYLQYNTTRLIDDKRLEMYRRRNQTEAYDSEPNEKASKPQKYHYETQSKKPTDAKAQKSPRSGEKDEKRLGASFNPPRGQRTTLKSPLLQILDGSTEGLCAKTSSASTLPVPPKAQVSLATVSPRKSPRRNPKYAQRASRAPFGRKRNRKGRKRSRKSKTMSGQS